MATYAQRITAIGNALVNGTATTPQMDRLGAALAGRAGRAAEYAAATQAGKAQIAVEETCRVLLDVIRQHETVAATASVEGDVAATFAEGVG